MKKQNGLFKIIEKAVPDVALYVYGILLRHGVETDKISTENDIMNIFQRYDNLIQDQRKENAMEKKLEKLGSVGLILIFLAIVITISKIFSITTGQLAIIVSGFVALRAIDKFSVKG